MPKYQAQEGGSILLAYRIVKRVRQGPVTSAMLMNEWGISKNAARRHLNAAYESGLMKRERWTYSIEI